MKTAILSVGTELLFGQITNTNTVYLSQQLNLLGFDVMYHYTVGDNPERVAEMIRLAFKDCDLVLTTGGLGPTQDDLTKEVACRVLGDELVMMDDVLEDLTAYFRKNGRQMTDNNKKQAIMPSRAKVFRNDAGTAPGFALDLAVKDMELARDCCNDLQMPNFTLNTALQMYRLAQKKGCGKLDSSSVIQVIRDLEKKENT